MELPVAMLRDEVCMQILDAERDRRSLTRVRLSPREYEVVARSKRTELDHGNGLVLLGLEVVKDAALPAGRVATE
jgi:hypothetical protein